MINMVKRFIFCILKLKKNMLYIKMKVHLQNLKCETCTDQTIKCINNFNICFIRVWIKIFK